MTKRLVHFRNTDRFARVENRKKNAAGDQGIVWSSCQNSSNMNGGSNAGAGGKWLNGVQYAFQVVATTIETTTPLTAGTNLLRQRNDRRRRSDCRPLRRRRNRRRPNACPRRRHDLHDQRRMDLLHKQKQHLHRPPIPPLPHPALTPPPYSIWREFHILLEGIMTRKYIVRRLRIQGKLHRE